MKNVIGLFPSLARLGVLGMDSPPDMLQAAEDLGFAVQFIAEIPLPFVQLRYPLVG